jgi:WD40 repeat protein
VGRVASAGQGVGPIAFSPDGKLLAAKGPGEWRVVEVHDVSSGQVRAVLNQNLPRRVDWMIPGNAWFSPDGRALLLEDIGGYTSPQRVQCWDLSGAAPRLAFQGPSESITPDGSRAAIAEFDHISRWDPVARDNSVVEVFDASSPQVRTRIVETGVHKATISPSGRIMALPSDRWVGHESLSVGLLAEFILRSIGVPWGGLAAPRPPIAVREIRFRDAATGRLVGTIDRSARPHPPGSMTFSPDGKTLVVRYFPAGFSWDSRNPMIDWSVELWDVPADRPGGAIGPPAAALTAVSLVLVAAWLDRRRALRGHPPGRC